MQSKSCLCSSIVGKELCGTGPVLLHHVCLDSGWIQLPTGTGIDLKSLQTDFLLVLLLISVVWLKNKTVVRNMKYNIQTWSSKYFDLKHTRPNVTYHSIDFIFNVELFQKKTRNLFACECKNSWNGHKDTITEQRIRECVYFSVLWTQRTRNQNNNLWTKQYFVLSANRTQYLRQ